MIGTLDPNIQITCIYKNGFIFRTRNYTPPDKPGYFEKIVWPESINHLREIQDQDDIGKNLHLY